jgi:hypothetical protein
MGTDGCQIKSYRGHGCKVLVMGNSSGQPKEGKMRIWRVHLAAISILIAGPLFLYDPSPVFADPFPNDTNGHFASAPGQCSNSNGHMNDLQPILNPQTFTICKKQSGATEWRAEIRSYMTSTLVCSIALANVTTDEKTFTCNTPFPRGSYKAYVIWYVNGGNPMTMIDQRFQK